MAQLTRRLSWTLPRSREPFERRLVRFEGEERGVYSRREGSRIEGIWMVVSERGIWDIRVLGKDEDKCRRSVEWR